MATVDKDFKVKNGLVVANGGTFGNAVVVGENDRAYDPVTAAQAADSLCQSDWRPGPDRI